MSLYNAQQAHQAIQTAWKHAKGWLMAGDTRLTLEIRPEKRSDAQNRRLWAMLADISAQVEWHGKKLGAEDWKAIFTASLRSMNVVPNLDNTGFVVLGQSTSRMTKAEMCELQELMEAFGAEKGVRFRAPDGWDD
jgi:hypothetical protein